MLGLDSIRDVYDFYSSTINLLAFDFPLSKTVGSVRLIRENISLFHIAEVEAYLKGFSSYINKKRYTFLFVSLLTA